MNARVKMIKFIPDNKTEEQRFIFLFSPFSICHFHVMNREIFVKYFTVWNTYDEKVL